ncbi:hypothetical protein, partial [Arthrobacter psychrochitiniphilus]
AQERRPNSGESSIAIVDFTTKRGEPAFLRPGEGTVTGCCVPLHWMMTQRSTKDWKRLNLRKNSMIKKFYRYSDLE